MTDWGTTYEGPFVDNVQGQGGGATVLFADDAESGDAKWTYAAPMAASATARRPSPTTTTCSGAT